MVFGYFLFLACMMLGFVALIDQLDDIKKILKNDIVGRREPNGR